MQALETCAHDHRRSNRSDARAGSSYWSNVGYVGGEYFKEAYQYNTAKSVYDYAVDPNIDTARDVQDRGVAFAVELAGAKMSGALKGSGKATTKTVARTNAQLVDDIGTRAGQWARRSRQQTALADASPQTVGIKQHGYAKDLLDRYQRAYGQRGLSTEVRYLDGLPWERGQTLQGDRSLGRCRRSSA